MDSGALFCFIGIDGSGKTTQAELLLDWLKSSGVSSEYVWSRGAVRTIRSILLFIGRSTLGTSAKKISSDEKSYHEYQSRKTKLMENEIVRKIWSIITYFEHLIQINMDIRIIMQKGCSVVCDRYLWDSNIDIAVLNNKSPEWLENWYNKFMWKFVPRPTITFFIDIPPEEAMKRKNDIPSFDYVKKRADLYRYLATRNSFIVIDGCGDTLEIQSKIRNTVKDHLKGMRKIWLN